MTEGGPCISSVMRAPKLCHNHKLLGGAASILLLSGVIRATFTIKGISTFKPVRRMLCYHSQRIGLREMQLISLMPSLTPYSTVTFSTCQHSSEMHKPHTSCGMHPQQLRNGQAVSSSIAGIAAPVAAGAVTLVCWNFKTPKQQRKQKRGKK